MIDNRLRRCRLDTASQQIEPAWQLSSLGQYTPIRSNDNFPGVFEHGCQYVAVGKAKITETTKVFHIHVGILPRLEPERERLAGAVM